MIDPDDILAELWNHARGYIEEDWSDIRREEIANDGVERPLVKSLGDEPLSKSDAHTLREHEQVREVWCAAAADVRTTSRGMMSGAIPKAEIETDDAVFLVSYVGWCWFSWHPVWLDENLADREDRHHENPIKEHGYHDSFDDYVSSLQSPDLPEAMRWGLTPVGEL